jgi:putative methionine-R-sulfoxide reductase with GAF domain
MSLDARRAIDEIDEIVTGQDAHDAKAKRIADAIRRSGGYRWVGVYDVTADEVAIAGWSGPGPPAHPRFPRTQGLTGAAIGSRSTVVVNDVTIDPRYLEAFGDTRAELIVPVLLDGEVIGTLDVESERPNAFGSAARAALEACASAARGLWLQPAGDERARAQLAAIGEVHELLLREGIDHWLFGGWAVDFHVRRVTRSHDDVDLAVWAAEAERIGALLERTGWTHAPEPDEDGGTGYARGPVRLELTYLVRSADGSVRIPLREGEVPWVDGSLDDELVELDGKRCHVLGYEALLRTKLRRRDDPRDGAKDAADVAELRRASADPPS